MFNLARKNHSEDVTEAAKPVLKWVGGKTQLLPEIYKRIPKNINRYIEPFIGGGALFFSYQPKSSIISDLNPEIINLYKCIAEDVDKVIKHLKKFSNTEEEFYQIRSLDFNKLDKFYAAARTAYLNKTCYNGLYRVNKKGEFNVPYGRYKNPNICQEENLRSASIALKNATILCGDYKSVLSKHAKPNDLVFLDPPYLPVSKYADFKRYTKEQFYEEDHRELAEEVKRLHEIGCHTILTNSNHPLVYDLYGQFDIEVIQTKRNISSKSNTRFGEDVIVNVLPKAKFNIRGVPSPIPAQASLYPSTRYMGSKEKLLPYIQDVAKEFKFNSVLDLFSGSGVVSYLFKSMGKQVFTNDYMTMSSTLTHAMIENNSTKLDKRDVQLLLKETKNLDDFVSRTFADLYFSDEDNAFIDKIRTNLKKIKDPYKKSIAKSALIRACLKKRPRGIFTYVGHRYDDGRADLKTSFEDHFLSAVKAINSAVFDNGLKNIVKNEDAMKAKFKAPDLVYLDPPYYSALSDNEYVRRYHFVEGLARDWQGVDIQHDTKTKKFKSYPTPFTTRSGAEDAFDKLFSKYKNSIIILSYSSNSLPSKDEIISLLSKYKQRVEVINVDYKYSFANQKHTVGTIKNSVHEYLFIGF